jgi:hypothetical protein
MPEGVTFPDIKSFKPLTVKFATLWYSSDMNKQWQSNAVFHTYYIQLKRSIEVEPRMTSNTLQRFRPLMKFNTDRHFTYITTREDEHKEQLQSYYKLTEEELEEITKEWSVDLLIPTNLTDIYDIDSPEDIDKEHNTPGTSRQKKTEEVQNLKTTLVSPNGGGDDEVEAEQKLG